MDGYFQIGGVKKKKSKKRQNEETEQERRGVGEGQVDVTGGDKEIWKHGRLGTKEKKQVKRKRERGGEKVNVSFLQYKYRSNYYF